MRGQERLLRDAFDAAVKVASPSVVVADWVQHHVREWVRTQAPAAQTLWVFAVGKAAASMVAAFEDAWEKDPYVPLAGLGITRHGHSEPTRFVPVREAGHPVPDEAGQQAAVAWVECLERVPPHDAVVALISGGGSSLLGVPAQGLGFDDLLATHRTLLASGAPIEEMNAVRKHITRTLGGQAAAVCKAPVCVGLISDVPGDDPAVVASGPFCADTSTFADAWDIVKRWHMELPPAVVAHLQAGVEQHIPDTPKPGLPLWERIQTHTLASNALSLRAVETLLSGQGYRVLSLGDGVQGESRDIAKAVAQMARQIDRGAPHWPSRPCALISGGECTVTLPRGIQGARGGRNSEFLLSLIERLPSEFDWCGLAADTDGIDGSEDNAGALWLQGDAAVAHACAVHARAYLDKHDAFGFFQATDRLLVTGPTRTNVNDIRIVLLP